MEVKEQTTEQGSQVTLLKSENQNSEDGDLGTVVNLSVFYCYRSLFDMEGGWNLTFICLLWRSFHLYICESDAKIDPFECLTINILKFTRIASSLLS